jgi:hypothetical protein
MKKDNIENAPMPPSPNFVDDSIKDPGYEAVTDMEKFLSGRMVYYKADKILENCMHLSMTGRWYKLTNREKRECLMYLDGDWGEDGFYEPPFRLMGGIHAVELKFMEPEQREFLETWG